MPKAITNIETKEQNVLELQGSLGALVLCHVEMLNRSITFFHNECYLFIYLYKSKGFEDED